MRRWEDPNKQSGRTTQQMLDAPPNAIYVWCNSLPEYPKKLARQLNRPDIKVVSAAWVLREENWKGFERDTHHVVLDHYCYETFDRKSFKGALSLAERGLLHGKEFT
jgi:hypothetical protein